jgi:hypothetical protein
MRGALLATVVAVAAAGSGRRALTLSPEHAGLRNAVHTLGETSDTSTFAVVYGDRSTQTYA